MELLDYLLAAELVADERAGRGLILRGDVLVNERPVTSPRAQVPAEAVVRLRRAAAETELRGARKLRPVAETLGFDCSGKVCLDLGVGSGGFTQVLLERGALRVYAVDVAYGMVALTIRGDPRVILRERTNARLLSRREVPEDIERAVGDLSFISWAAVLPAVAGLLAPQAELLLLVKPQFELAARGRGGMLAAGLVRDMEAVRDSLASLYNTWQAHGLSPQAVRPAAVRGAKGNQEYFVHLKHGKAPPGEQAYGALCAAALAEAAP